MRPIARTVFAVLPLTACQFVAGLSDRSSEADPGAGAAESTAGSGGNAGEGGGASGGTPAGTSGNGGNDGGAGSAGTPAGGGMAGEGGIAGNAGAAGSAGQPPGGDPVGWMGFPGIEDLSMQKPTAGCGMPAGVQLDEWVQYDTEVAIPDGHNGPGGDAVRRYFVKLPPDYDPSTVYKLVIGGSSCVSQSGPRPIDYADVTNATGGAIQITPETEPGVMSEGAYNCYDDKDTNSIEYPLIQTMLQEVGEKFCYDQHKVFVQGHDSGGWYANMMGCVYGSTLIRAMSSNGGGIAQGDGVRPPCKENPIPGLWILPTGDAEGRQETYIALDNALTVNQCEGGGVARAWETAPFGGWSEGGAQNCKKYQCPEAFPVIFCQPAGGHGLVAWHDDAGWAFFNSLP